MRGVTDGVWGKKGMEFAVGGILTDFVSFRGWFCWVGGIVGSIVRRGCWKSLCWLRIRKRSRLGREGGFFLSLGINGFKVERREDLQACDWLREWKVWLMGGSDRVGG